MWLLWVLVSAQLGLCLHDHVHKSTLSVFYKISVLEIVTVTVYLYSAIQTDKSYLQRLYFLKRSIKMINWTFVVS